MRLLLLGGPRFLGYHLIEAALRRGHALTLFNRGRTGAQLFPEVERLTGDRDGNLGALESGRWDAAIDTCGYVPRLVGASARLLAGRVGHYTFISSISVYADPVPGRLDESAPVGTLADLSTEEITGESYGPLKALSENAAAQAMPGRVLTVRPGLIVGPRDPTDRFTYWPARFARGGEVLCPPEDLPVQIIDVRDLAEWIVRLIEEHTIGVFNATGPREPITFEAVTAACLQAAGGRARAVHVPESFLLEQKVGPWIELPLWLPESDYGSMRAGIGKALAAGLTFRPLVETVEDTLAWRRTRPAETALKAGLSLEREAALLEAFRRG